MHSFLCGPSEVLQLIILVVEVDMVDLHFLGPAGSSAQRQGNCISQDVHVLPLLKKQTGKRQHGMCQHVQRHLVLDQAMPLLHLRLKVWAVPSLHDCSGSEYSGDS